MQPILLNKKNIYITSAAIILVAFLVLIIFPFFGANAISETLCNNMLKVINDGPITAIRDTLTGSIYEEMMSHSAVTTTKSVVFGLATGMVVLHAYITMITEIHRGQNGVESFIKALIETIVAACILLYLDEILKAIDDLGKGLFDQLSTVLEASSNSGTTLTMTQLYRAKKTGELDFLYYGGVMFAMLLPWVGSWASQVVGYIAAFSILFELGIRRVFMPFAVSDIISEGLRSPGIRYLKRYLAVYIKMCLCLVICALIRVFLTAASGNVIMILATYFTALSLMFKTGEYANDIVGA